MPLVTNNNSDDLVVRDGKVFKERSVELSRKRIEDIITNLDKEIAILNQNVLDIDEKILGITNEKRKYENLLTQIL